MKVDFHTHGKLAKKLPFSAEYTKWLFSQARKEGLDAICLTEHFNTREFERLYRYVSGTCRRSKDIYVCENGLRVIAGMETDIAEGGHILSIGTLEEIIWLNRELKNHKEKERFLAFRELMNLFEETQVMIGAAHPFRNGGSIPDLPEEQLRRLHFIDLNGKDVAMEKDRTIRNTKAFAEKLEIPVVCGSDTHQAVQYGCVNTDFEKNPETIEEIYDEMDKKRYSINISDRAAEKVDTACVLKKALKKIHELGGDYMTVLAD